MAPVLQRYKGGFKGKKKAFVALHKIIQAFLQALPSCVLCVVYIIGFLEYMLCSLKESYACTSFLTCKFVTVLDTCVK